MYFLNLSMHSSSKWSMAEAAPLTKNKLENFWPTNISSHSKSLIPCFCLEIATHLTWIQMHYYLFWALQICRELHVSNFAKQLSLGKSAKVSVIIIFFPGFPLRRQVYYNSGKYGSFSFASLFFRESPLNLVNKSHQNSINNSITP